MIPLIINIINPKNKNAKIELSVPTLTKDDFSNAYASDAFLNTTADYLPDGDFQVIFGNSIYEIQIIEK